MESRLIRKMQDELRGPNSALQQIKNFMTEELSWLRDKIMVQVDCVINEAKKELEKKLDMLQMQHDLGAEVRQKKTLEIVEEFKKECNKMLEPLKQDFSIKSGELCEEIEKVTDPILKLHLAELDLLDAVESEVIDWHELALRTNVTEGEQGFDIDE